MLRDVPVGVQIVAGHFREDLCLLAGEAIEARGAPPSAIDPAMWAGWGAVPVGAVRFLLFHNAWARLSIKKTEPGLRYATTLSRFGQSRFVA